VTVNKLMKMYFRGTDWILVLHPKNRGSKVLQNADISYHITTRCHNPEDNDMNLRQISYQTEITHERASGSLYDDNSEPLDSIPARNFLIKWWKKILYYGVNFAMYITYQLISDDKLDHWQRVEHSNSEKIPQVQLWLLTQDSWVLACKVHNSQEGFCSTKEDNKITGCEHTSYKQRLKYKTSGFPNKPNIPCRPLINILLHNKKSWKEFI